MGIRLFEAERAFLLDPKGFRARLTHPVLVWPGAAADAEKEEGANDVTDTGARLTRPPSGEVVIIPVVKQDARANAFAMGITVGRVSTNDIVLDDPSISRFHAYFQGDATRGWTLTDADSQHGTRVLGQRLNGHQRIDDGAKLTFGGVETWFLLPERYCAWLQAGADPAALR